MDINKILKKEDVSSAYGAPMGRRDTGINDISPGEKLHLQKMRLVDGDYDTGGAYWGNTPGTSMYCAFCSGLMTMIFIRAKSRDEAKKNVLELLPEGVKFFK
jgi:hypothetical protein